MDTVVYTYITRYIYYIQKKICIYYRRRIYIYMYMYISSLLGLVSSTSGAKARKSSNRASWDYFCRLLGPRPESHQIEPPGTTFIDFWGQGQKVIKSSLLGLVFSTSGAKARKSSNRASWDWFCRLLEPRPGSH